MAQSLCVPHTHTHTHSKHTSKHTFLSLCMLHTFICRDTAEYTPTHYPGGLEPTDQQKEYQTQYQTSQHLNVSHTHLKLYSVYSPGMDYTTKNFLYKMLYTLPHFTCLHWYFFYFWGVCVCTLEEHEVFQTKLEVMSIMLEMLLC